MNDRMTDADGDIATSTSFDTALPKPDVSSVLNMHGAASAAFCYNERELAVGKWTLCSAPSLVPSLLTHVRGVNCTLRMYSILFDGLLNLVSSSAHYIVEKSRSGLRPPHTRRAFSENLAKNEQK